MAGVIIVWTVHQNVVHAYIAYALFSLVSSCLALASLERVHFSCDVSHLSFGLDGKAFICNNTVPTLLL